jgi:hypothetical protein
MAVLPVSLWRVAGWRLQSRQCKNRQALGILRVRRGRFNGDLKVCLFLVRVSHKKSCGSSLPSLATLRPPSGVRHRRRSGGPTLSVIDRLFISVRGLPIFQFCVAQIVCYHDCLLAIAIITFYGRSLVPFCVSTGSRSA